MPLYVREVIRSNQTNHISTKGRAWAIGPAPWFCLWPTLDPSDESGHRTKLDCTKF